MEIKKVIVGVLQTNCYIISSGDDAVIVDPGDEAGKIVDEVEGKSVKHIITTHHHFDHVSAKNEVQEKTGAEVLENLKEGDEIKIGEEKLSVISTPGHTEDSICLIGEGFVISGDTLFYQGYGRTDLPGGSEEKLKESLARLTREIPEGAVVYPGHGRSFTFET